MVDQEGIVAEIAGSGKVEADGAPGGDEAVAAVVGSHADLLEREIGSAGRVSAKK